MHIAQLAPPTYNQVTKYNLAQLQPKIFELLKQAEFIALDAEFTGLGTNPGATRVGDIQERYHNLCKLAKTHALIAFGLSIFINGTVKADESRDREHSYTVHNFNFSMLNETDYSVSPKSMIFLAENGLDLNQWILEGIPYTGGDRLVNEGGRDNPNGIMRSIFKRIMTQRAPVVVHNGFLDLVFLYHSFYASLPPQLSTFVADLSDMFPGGLYDTKYVSDYITRERSSFLAYLFRKYERHNIRAKDGIEPTRNQVYSTFDVRPRLELPALHGNQEATIPRTKSSKASTAYCENYALHGVCKLNMRCGLSHDLDLILDAEEQQDSRKRKRRKRNNGTADRDGTDGGDHEAVENGASGSSEAGEGNGPSRNAISGTSEQSATATRTVENATPRGERFHSAYFDAFMTGAVFSHQMNQHQPERIESQSKNKVYLIGKSIPLIVEKSAFAKFSPEHERLRVL
ncbi:MAG: ribonuclease CAF1 [Benniella sp.]|nr:MAG: ribonuclease CAF1 [Benniella sp.]